MTLSLTSWMIIGPCVSNAFARDVNGIQQTFGILGTSNSEMVANSNYGNGFRPLICLMVEGYLLFWGGGGFSTKMVKTKKVIYFGGI